jgi:hypothetical protein
MDSGNNNGAAYAPPALETSSVSTTSVQDASGGAQATGSGDGSANDLLASLLQEASKKKLKLVRASFITIRLFA